MEGSPNSATDSEPSATSVEGSPDSATDSEASATTMAEENEDAPDKGSDRVIVLGSSSGGSQGFGWSRPSRVFLGGDPTGDVRDITWDGWGLDVAEGTGTSSYVPDGKSVSEATQEKARIRAWDPGQCNGKLAYRKVAWWFPGQGETGPVESIDACR